MRQLQDLEIGLMFWAEGTPAERLQYVQSFGLAAGQLGVGGDYRIDGQAKAWNQAIADQGFHIATVFCSYPGEDYTNFASVMDTIGLVPPATRSERIARTKEVSDFAAAIHVSSIACHIGFVPHEKNHPDYQALCAVVGDICDHCEAHGQTFALETGQEPAKVLLRFLEDVGKDNLRINFDPANMILYGTGNPIEALDVLAPKITSAHCKDGDWPSPNQSEALGVEKPLGQGSVDVEAYVSKLKEVGYRGILSIEREEVSQTKRNEDIRRAVEILRNLTKDEAAATA